MAIRKILTEGEATLRKRSKTVTEFNKRLHVLIDDMRDTLNESKGAGLAAPQVGILRSVALVLETNVNEGEEEYIIELINPEIIETDGEQSGVEGCLSFPGVFGMVTRPETVRIRAMDRFGNYFETEGTGLTARAFCHEVEHLNGEVFLTKIEYMVDPEDLKTQDEAEEKGGV
ncbi:MAG: peptide deformylase [Oscillospiraceae bacterium]|nr:peptide deformylase [Oscillospiraceae bacterium]